MAARPQCDTPLVANVTSALTCKGTGFIRAPSFSMCCKCQFDGFCIIIYSGAQICIDGGVNQHLPSYHTSMSVCVCV